MSDLLLNFERSISSSLTLYPARADIRDVTRFEVRSDVLSEYDVQDAGGIAHREYWIPAEELDAFNAAIVGAIEVVRTFP